MMYELFYYRLSMGRDLRSTYDLDMSTRDSDEATLEPFRRLDPHALAQKLIDLKIGFTRRVDDDVFSRELDRDGEEASESVELVLEHDHGTAIVVSLWECHVRLALPTGEVHPERDGIYEKVILDVTMLCHDEGLLGYDPKHDQPVTPATLHQIAVDAAEGEPPAKPWWKLW